MTNRDYSIGEHVTVTGYVTGVSSVNGNSEYTVVVDNGDDDSPVRTGQPLDTRVAFASGPVEQAEANAARYAEVAELSAEADREKADDDEANSEEAERVATPTDKKEDKPVVAKSATPTAKATRPATR